MKLDSQDQVFLGTTFATAVVGAALIIVGFVLRFGRACILVLMFLVAVLATLRKNQFLLKFYCAVIALMVIVQLVAGLLAFTYSDQINQLASDDGCEKQIRSRISADTQYLGAASMGVVVVEIIASFLAGYRAYNYAHPDG
ncbi:unnamed protein product [Nippostrongylus brasiliensis]|uniref:Membrane spanning protein n=1 Tax=Nippostrongylus brasiliensis TaxID=27835 RepID=A0A0N4XTQ3_NIPBR|nr:unnamed protein product [Nippostrongylus brasiliensis]